MVIKVRLIGVDRWLRVQWSSTDPVCTLWNSNLPNILAKTHASSMCLSVFNWDFFWIFICSIGTVAVVNKLSLDHHSTSATLHLHTTWSQHSYISPTPYDISHYTGTLAPSVWHCSAFIFEVIACTLNLLQENDHPNWCPYPNYHLNHCFKMSYHTYWGWD